jgi:D-aminoacyl-tRNA deacylase
VKVVIQKVSQASCEVNNEVISRISQGLLLLVCFEKGDQEDCIKKAVDKILQLRIFENPETNRMDLNILQVKGEILSISQFTLSWDGKKGNRPSFDNSMPPQEAEKMYTLFFIELKRQYQHTHDGKFGSHMKINICNNGPVTFSLHF